MSLRWLVQQDVIVIPRTANLERLKANIAIFDFVLSPGEMAISAGLARPGGRVVNMAWGPRWD